MSQSQEPIAIIGTGCRFPGGSDTPSKLWDLLHQPRDLLTKVPEDRFNSKAFYHPDPNHHGTSNVRDAYFLSENTRHFDAQFFGIQPLESDSIDPQQRMLLETVYESVAAAGLTIEELRGSATAVYVGLMCDDWAGLITRDWEACPTYSATGMARSLISNRVSYFFDWRGPSMTIDTACSSSLVAVHLAVQSLRSGETKVAVAAGANLILSPGMSIAESKLHMLSPDGRCQMWDEAANGYARGEGLASVVLKTLSQALADGDHIECLIRETGLNQDGRTTGITMPNNIAQTALIKQTYTKAGLDLSIKENRPQFFYAHGTGTPAGDPQEAEAIKNAFFDREWPSEEKLLVGSIKTIIGHTEGSAGLASLIGASLAIQHGIVPPNMHFHNLSKKVAPFYHHLEVVTKAQPWPVVPHGQPRRVSVNSFGFGGSNAHAILESYQPFTEATETQSGSILFTPLTFSATSDRALRNTLQSYAELLATKNDLDIRDLAWTLQNRRSNFALKTTISGMTIGNLRASIESKISEASNDNTAIGIHSSLSKSPAILGVFTGQGAQWATMGRELINSSAHVREIIAKLDQSLAELPESDRPSWKIKDELMAAKETSRLGNAALSQPLCTAIQVVLVDLLRAAGIRFQAVVGHSSGEIGAAYSSGLISATDAIRIAYYRGLFTKLAASPTGHKGAMMAVGTSLADATEFCDQEEFKGRLVVAARNSSSSITLSGDEDAIDMAVEVFQDQQKFARKLKVDTAYHSFHMKPCSMPYLQAIQEIKVEAVGTTSWFSSVDASKRMSHETLTAKYWMENMVCPVMFSDAVAHAVSVNGPFDLVLELGPHPALKGPCLANLEEASGIAGTPYFGTLARGRNDVESLSMALGSIWAHLGPSSVDFDSYDKKISGNIVPKNVVKDLPNYPWEHQRDYWFESRISGSYALREEGPHPLLGTKCAEATTSQEFQWRNILRPTEVPWLNGHKLQGQTVFPASGYVAMGVEAMKSIVGVRKIRLIEVKDVSIPRAITFNDDTSSVETLVEVALDSPVQDNSELVIGNFKCYSKTSHDKSLAIAAAEQVIFHLGDLSASSLPVIPFDHLGMISVGVDRFYDSLTKLGYNYSEPFHAISDLQHKMDHASGILTIDPSSDWEDQLLVHPGMLDSAFQTGFAAYCSPGDNRLRCIHVPTSIERITINPYFCSNPEKSNLPFQTVITSTPTADIQADGEIFSENGEQTFISIEGARLTPFSAPSASNDSPLFSNFIWRVAHPDGQLAAQNEHPSADETIMAYAFERLSFFYLKQLVDTITDQERAETLWHYQHLLDWATHVVGLVSRGQHPVVSSEHLSDTYEQLMEIVQPYLDRPDARLLVVVGQNLPECIRSKRSILEFMTQDNLWSHFLNDGVGFITANGWIGRMAKQISHRYPHMNILEIGAGTGAATKAILGELGPSFSSYTYTDISSGFFEAAEARFEKYSERLVFKLLDVEKDVIEQGFAEGFYDMIIASNVLHATEPLERTLENARRLLKPGGYLLFLEVTNNDSLRNMLPLAGLPGWWVGANNGRKWAPYISLLQWDSLLRKTGFSGVDTTTPECDTLHPISVFSTQAIDTRVELLRQPLSNSSLASTPILDNLVIIGGETPATAHLVAGMENLLTSRFKNVAHIPSIQTLTTTRLLPASTVICISELDEPFFKSLTSSKLDCVKTLFTQARDILFVTSGCRFDEPYSNMMVGIGRGLKYEYPNVNLQMLDIDNLGDGSAKLFASNLIRLLAVNAWSRERVLDDLLWSIEPEISIDKNTELIPRLLPNQPANDRYNSSKRPITRDLNPQSSRVEIVATKSSKYELKESPKSQLGSADIVTIRVTHSLLRSIKIQSAGFLFLCVGQEINSDSTTIALSATRSSVIDVPSEWTAKYDTGVDPVQLLLSVAGCLMSQSLTSTVPPGGTLVVHNPYTSLTPALSWQAAKSQFKVCFTRTQTLQHDSTRAYVHSQTPRREIHRIIPQHASLFAELILGNNKDEVANRIANCYAEDSTRCEQIRLLSRGSSAQSELSISPIGAVFKAAIAISKELIAEAKAAKPATVVSLRDVPLYCSSSEAELVVDWCRDPSVSVSVQPVDSEDLFHSNRTYLLVGLSGDTGRSICQWMVAHGARYVVLTSRNPKVSPEWIESLAAMGATVKAFSLDITDRNSLHSVYQTICQTLPPIAGVANGAMLLRDRLFENMDLDNMVTVLKPKVDGSRYLDELFCENTLDFFICFSSIAAVIGNTGQSNYIAANMFMASLALQRKKRGLAGSAIDISSVIGVGVIERSGNFDAEYFGRSGFISNSEQDLHQLFAEAILAGNPASPDSCEIVSGFGPAYSDIEMTIPYRKDLKFCHFILERPHDLASTTQDQAIPVKFQLLAAKSQDEVYNIVKDSFAKKLKKILQIPADGEINETMSLVEQGVDSLVAVEIRSWFLSEVDIDMPVLRVLGTGSIPDLVDDAVQRLPVFQEKVSSTDLPTLVIKELATSKETVTPPRHDTVPPSPSSGSSSLSSEEKWAKIEESETTSISLETPPSEKNQC